MSAQILESDFWAHVKKNISVPGLHAFRIEDSVGAGTFDLNVCANGVETWVELKVLKGRRVHFRNSQRIWAMKRLAVGSRLLVMVRGPESLYVCPGSDIVEMPSKVVVPGKSFSLDIDNMSKLLECGKPFDWSGVLDILAPTVDQGR